MQIIHILLFLFLKNCPIQCIIIKECTLSDQLKNDNLLTLSKALIPSLEGKRKGEAGRIGIIGGSVEYTGAPYFAAISSLKVGADLVYVLTTESASPVIKSYSPDLIVYPFLNRIFLSDIYVVLKKMDVIIIGPGLGREDDTLQLIYDIIKECKRLKKALIIDADGLFAVSRNLTIIKDYPSPGVILTPNFKEAKKLQQSIPTNEGNWFSFWGEFVSVLIKGEEDKYYTNDNSLQWNYSADGSGRRAGGQGDILSGALGTFYNWALKSNICESHNTVKIAQSVATNAAVRLTRKCNSNAYGLHGRSMIASDMLKQIHSSFEFLFDIVA